MEAGNALEPVVARAMERAGWKVDSADSQDPQTVAVRVGPNMIVTGPPRRHGADASTRKPDPDWVGGTRPLIRSSSSSMRSL